MTLRVLADENVDHRVVHRLAHYGHDVEHVDEAPDLGKGTDDASVVEYSSTTGRAVLTSDDDFLTEFDSDGFPALLFIEDESLGPTATADIVHEIGSATESEPSGVVYVSRTWI
jgi:predicted nuclease of predicted toxin-antitoxin system